MNPHAVPAPADRRELLASLLLRRHRQHFGVLGHKTYLNFGAQGLLPRPALEALRSFYEETERAAPLTAEGGMALLLALRQARAALASALRAPETAIALVESTSTGCNIALWGIDWRCGDRLVISDREYPGVAAAVSAVAGRFGVEVVTWPLAGPRERRLEDLAGLLGPRTRAVVVSHVPWDTGEVLPLAEIARLCRDRGEGRIRLIVDGAQAVGVLPLDLPAMGADVYAFPGHKWWCGPEGAAGLYVGPEALAELQPTFVGPRSFAFTSSGEVSGFLPGASRFEVSTSAAALHAALRVAVGLHEEWGTAEARLERILRIGRRLWEGLGEMEPDRLVRQQTAPPETGLVFFRVLGWDSQRLVRSLEGRGIVLRAIPHTGYVRASVHYLNLEEEVDRLLDAVRSLHAASRDAEESVPC